MKTKNETGSRAPADAKGIGGNWNASRLRTAVAEARLDSRKRAELPSVALAL